MNYESIHECCAKLYKNGLVVIYKTNPGRSRDELIEAARQPRHYHIRKSEVTSAAINLWHRRKHQVWFITFTFAFNPDEKEMIISRIWTNYLKNLKLNYNVNNYVWVKERGKKNNRIHYHAIIDSPRNNICKLQDSFNSAVKNYDNTLPVSNNSVRLGDNPRVFNIQQCAKEIAKYCTKSIDTIFTQKAYGLTLEVSDVCTEIDTVELDKLALKYVVKHLFYDDFFELKVLQGFNAYEYFDKKTVRFRTPSEIFS